jgi:hypothetical protein
MVKADPFDLWHVTEKPELTIRYEHGMNIPYYSYNQLRRAFEAGKRSATPTTVTTTTHKRRPTSTRSAKG